MQAADYSVSVSVSQNILWYYLFILYCIAGGKGHYFQGVSLENTGL